MSMREMSQGQQLRSASPEGPALPPGPRQGETRQPTAAEVKLIQTAFQIDEPGYGARTREAVAKLQMAHGIAVDAQVSIGARTWGLVLEVHNGTISPDGRAPAQPSDRVAQAADRKAEFTGKALDLAEAGNDLALIEREAQKLESAKSLLQHGQDGRHLNVNRALQRELLSLDKDIALNTTRYNLGNPKVQEALKLLSEEKRVVQSLGRKLEGAHNPFTDALGLVLSVGPHLVQHIRENPSGFYKDPAFRQDLLSDLAKWGLPMAARGGGAWVGAAIGSSVLPGVGTAVGGVVGALVTSLGADALISFVPGVSRAIEKGAKWVDQHVVTPVVDRVVAPAAQAISNAIKPVVEHAITPVVKPVLTSVVAPAAQFLSKHVVQPIVVNVVLPVAKAVVLPVAKAVDKYVLEPVVKGVEKAVKVVEQAAAAVKEGAAAVKHAAVGAWNKLRSWF